MPAALTLLRITCPKCKSRYAYHDNGFGRDQYNFGKYWIEIKCIQCEHSVYQVDSEAGSTMARVKVKMKKALIEYSERGLEFDDEVQVKQIAREQLPDSVCRNTECNRYGKELEHIRNIYRQRDERCCSECKDWGTSEDAIERQTR